MKLRYLSERMGKIAFIIFFLLQRAEGMMQFIPTEKLVGTSEYIVIAKVQTASQEIK